MLLGTFCLISSFMNLSIEANREKGKKNYLRGVGQISVVAVMSRLHECVFSQKRILLDAFSFIIHKQPKTPMKTGGF